MEWSLTLVPSLVALLLFFVPGFLIAVAARQKGFDALAVSPALSVAAIAVSAILAPLIGVAWTVWVPLIFAALLAAVLAGIFAVVGRRRSQIARESDQVSSRRVPDLVSPRWWSAEQGWAYAGFGIGVLLLLRNITNSIGNPNWVSQTYDAVFHLNAIRYIADTGNASSLAIGSMTSGGETPMFYPAAWHGVASLVFELSGASVPVVANTMSVVVGAVIWPLSILYFVRQALRVSRPTLLVAGAIAAAYVSFPLLLVFFGILYPNSLGISLLPVGLGLMVQVLGLAEVRRLTLGQGLTLGVMVALAIALAHPNMVMTLLVMTVPLLLFCAIRQVARGVRGTSSVVAVVVQVLLTAGALWLIWFLWGVVRPDRDAGGWEPTAPDTTGIAEALLNNSLGMGNLWEISLVALVGAFAVFHVRRNLVWVVALWAYTAYFYIAGRSMTWDDGRDWVTGVWYHDPFRIAALLPVAAVPLAVVGADYVITRLTPLVESVVRSRATVSLALVSALALVPLVWFTQTNVRLQNFIERSFWTYAPDIESPLLTPDEYNVLNAIDQYVPEDATIITNPWTGASLAYAFSGREVTGYHTVYTEDSDTSVLIDDLKEATTNPEVCQVFNRHKAYYAIYFGEVEINQSITGSHADEYGSLEYLADPDVIDGGGVAEVIYRSEGATLYHITACS